MKIFQFLAMLTISVLLFTGCEKEEITNYAFQEISAPTSVSANFDVAQDDSGDVSITPSGEGAQVFQVYFGDGNDTPVEVAPGETVSYTYGEGEYLVRVIAVGSTGLTSEFNQRLLISFKAPENLVVTVDQPANNPAMISVSASADFAASFDVYFGDAEDEEPTQLMPDGSIDHTYASPGTYIISVVAKGAGVATTETTVEVVIPEANDPVKLPITYDIPTVNYALGTFNGASFEVVTNPFLSGANPEESMVGAITNSGANFEGGAYNLGEPVDFSGDNKTISMKFYSETPVSVLVKFEGGTNDDRPNEVSADHGGTGWEVLTFDFGSDAVKSFLEGADDNGQAFVPTGKYSSLVLFVEIGETTAGTFYFDDIMQEAATADCVAETEENIDPANGPINWTFKTDDPAYAFEGFGNVEASIASNPVTDGINASCNVGKVVKNNPCESWAGLGKGLQTSMDFATTDKKVFTLKVLAENQATDVTLRLEFEPHPNVDPAEERVAQVTEVGVWQELTFDFSDVDDKTFKSIILYFERGAACDGDVYYFDDLKQTDGASGGGGSSAILALPFNFETAPVTSDFIDFDGGIATVVDNTQPTGNSSAKVAQLIRDGGQVWGGSKIILDSKLDFSSQGGFSMKVFTTAPIGTQVSLKLEDSTNGDINAEVGAVTTVTGAWETLTWDFTGKPLNTYDVLVFLFDLGNVGDGSANSTFLFDDIMQVDLSESKSQIDLPVDFESSTVDYTLTDFGDNVSSVIVDPFASNNTVAKVIKTNTAQTWAGTTIGTASGFATNIPITLTNSKMSVRVWSPDAGTPIRLKLEDANDPTHTVETEVNTTVAGDWETIEFDFTNQASGTESLSVGLDNGWVYNKASIFFNFGTDGATAGEKTYYFDDVLFIQ